MSSKITYYERIKKNKRICTKLLLFKNDKAK